MLSFLLRCSPPSPARSARNTGSSSWSTCCRAARAPAYGPRSHARSLIAADNVLWRVASWIANFAFVGVTGDLRRDLFRHLTGPFAELFRRSAARHADEPRDRHLECGVHRREYVRLERAAAVRGNRRGDHAGVHHQPADGRRPRARRRHHGVLMFRLAAAGRPLHHDFASKAAAVDGEMVDVVCNMPLVRAFGGFLREHRRFDATVDREMDARRRSLFYLEKLRIFHAVVTIVLALGLLAWAILLWHRARPRPATSCSPARSASRCCRRRAISRWRWSTSRSTSPASRKRWRPSGAARAARSPRGGAAGAARRQREVRACRFPLSATDSRFSTDFNLSFRPGERVGLVGHSGGGKSTLFALLQRFYDVQAGRILIDGQDIARVTQESLREAIGVVPQDISMFHRSVMENIRYGRPDATDDEVLRSGVRGALRLHRRPAGRHAHHRRRPRREAFRRPAPAHRHRARFLKDAPLLLLDEATSALDSESEEVIREALGRLMRGRTVIAIAHRLSTVRNFDRIVVLQAGEGRPGRRAGPPDAPRRPLS